MKLELEKLIELQKTDTNIRRLKKSIETAEQRRANIEQEFEQHASSIREIQNQAENAKKEHAELEKQAAEAKAHLERANRNLKTSTNQKQYETSMRELDVLQKQISGFEAQMLEKMTAIEDVDKVLSERSEEIAGLEGKRGEAVSEFEGQLEKDKAEYEVESKKREEVFVTLPPNLASVYNRLAMRSRDGIAVAEVVNGSCSACHMSLRPQMQLEIKRGDKIITCESCTRILYIAPPEAQAADAN